MAKNNLTSKDHDNMDAFIGAVIDDYKNGAVNKQQVIAGFAHVIAAIDLGNIDEARKWFEEGRKFILEELKD